MEPARLPYKNSSIAWYRYGDGPVTVLCFHGYSENAKTFEFLGKHGGDRFTFFAIDLPFHGSTEWNDGLDFTDEDLQSIIGQVIPAGDFYIIGYSLGGRVGLSLYESMPWLVKKIVLLAPDGLKVNAWYWLATQTIIGSRLFRFTMRHPSWFFGLLKFFNKLGFVNTSIFKFVNYYIGDAEVRELLFKRWTALRKLKPGLKHIKELISRHRTPVRIVYGKHDRIILSSVGDRFREGIEDHCIVSVIPSGHQVLHEKHIREILAALLP